MRFSFWSARAAFRAAFSGSRVQSAVKDDGTLEMCIYGDIVDATTMEYLNAYGIETDAVCTSSVKKQIEAAGHHTKIALRINSPGGDAFEGVAIHNLIRAQGKPVSVFVDGLAASSASIIAMAGDEITMPANSMMMIHNAWSWCQGNKNDMLKTANTLDGVDQSIAETYVQKSGLPMEDVKVLMDAESWLSAKDCLAKGLATAIAPDKQSAASAAMVTKFNLFGRFKAVPESLRNDAKTKRVDGEDLTWIDFIIAQDHEDIDTWHLPWKFSTVEKTKAHLRDALSRLDQVQGLSKEEKHAAYVKLVGLCKKYGIEVSAENKAKLKAWAGIQDTADNVNGCACSCDGCTADRCEDCDMQNCDDKDCLDCPMQSDANNSIAPEPKHESSLSLAEAEAIWLMSRQPREYTPAK